MISFVVMAEACKNTISAINSIKNKKIKKILWIFFILVSIISAIKIFNIFNINKLFNQNINMSISQKLQNISELNHSVKLELSEAVFKAFKGKDGVGIIEFIPTKNRDTFENVNYSGYVLNLREYEPQLDEIIESMEARLKYSKVDIPYGYKVSKEIQRYAVIAPNSSVSLSVMQMLQIDNVTMSKMWVDKSSLNGKNYHGNFDFEVSRADFAFALEDNLVAFQLLFIIDKTMEQNTKESERMEILENTRDKIMLLLNRF